MSAMGPQITSLTIVYSTVYLGANQRKHQSTSSLAFVRGIHRWPVNSPHKGPVTRKMLPFDETSPCVTWPFGVSAWDLIVARRRTRIRFMGLDYQLIPRHFADGIFRCIFMNEKFCIVIPISIEFVPKGSIDNKSILIQVMAWRRTGDKPISEPMLTQFTDAYMRHWEWGGC